MGTGDGEPFPKKPSETGVNEEAEEVALASTGVASYTNWLGLSYRPLAPFFPFVFPCLFPPNTPWFLPFSTFVPSSRHLIQNVLPLYSLVPARQSPPICQVIQAEPFSWIHLDVPHSGHGLAGSHDTQEGPGQGTSLAHVGLMGLSPHPWASLLLFQVCF